MELCEYVANLRRLFGVVQRCELMFTAPVVSANEWPDGESLGGIMADCESGLWGVSFAFTEVIVLIGFPKSAGIAEFVHFRRL